MSTVTPAPLYLTPEGVELEFKDLGFCKLVYKTERKHTIYTGKGLQWCGGKIKLSLWRQIISFLMWSQEKYRSESLVQLFYNTETKEWAAWAFPQRGVGMTVSHNEHDPAYATDRAQFPDPWVSFGSVHHHCTSKAFASGVDQQDELKKEGLHLTVGELDKPKLDLHARVSLQGQIFEPDFTEWFDVGVSECLGDLNAFGLPLINWALSLPAHGLHNAVWETRFSNTYNTPGVRYPGGFTPSANFSPSRRKGKGSSGGATKIMRATTNPAPQGKYQAVMQQCLDNAAEIVSGVTDAENARFFRKEITTLLTIIGKTSWWQHLELLVLFANEVREEPAFRSYFHDEKRRLEAAEVAGEMLSDYLPEIMQLYDLLIEKSLNFRDVARYADMGLFTHK